MVSRQWTLWIAVGLAAACAGAPAATPEQRELAERRLLAPFLTGREVGCSELLVELTGNFHRNVGQPALDQQRHTKVTERGDGYVETIWTNVSGSVASAFGCTIGEVPELTEQGLAPAKQTRFRVINRLRVRTYEDRRALMLNATTGGGIVVVREAKGEPKDVPQFAIADGVLRQS